MVSSGSYSDYRVHTVFSTKKLAKEYIGSFETDEYDYIGIEERELDGDVDNIKAGYKVFHVMMERNGDVNSVSKAYVGSSHPVYEAKFEEWCDDKLDCFVWARDKKHAIKIVNDRRIFLLANNITE